MSCSSETKSSSTPWTPARRSPSFSAPEWHPHLTTQKSFYVEIIRARDRAELVTDDAATLREHLKTATGERISALEGIGRGEAEKSAAARTADGAVRDMETTPGPGDARGSAPVPDMGIGEQAFGDHADTPRERQVELEFEL